LRQDGHNDWGMQQALHAQWRSRTELHIGRNKIGINMLVAALKPSLSEYVTLKQVSAWQPKNLNPLNLHQQCISSVDC
jgi:hypothetical protein